MVHGNINLVDTAFLQLSFALKLWNFLDVHPIDKDDFDIALTVEDGAARICLPHNEFATYDAVRVASEHNVSICFGVAANTLWEAMREKGDLRTGDLDPEADRAGNLASLTYMIRCCFAHGPAAPVWRIARNKYRTRYRVRNNRPAVAPRIAPIAVAAVLPPPLPNWLPITAPAAPPTRVPVVSF